MKFFTRARSIGIFGILAALLLFLSASTNLQTTLDTAREKGSKTAPESTWGYISTLNIPEPGTAPGSPPALSLKIPTLPTIAILSVGLIVVGAVLVIRNPDHGGIAAYMSSVIAVAFVLLLLWATAGKSADLADTLSRVIRLATPLVLGALAGIVCERSGVVNIGIEGMMLMGACVGYSMALVMGRIFYPDPANLPDKLSSLPLWIAVVFAMMAGGLMAMLHAWLSIRFKVDQIISGTVINIMAFGLAGYVRAIFLLDYAKTSPVRTGLPDAPIPGLANIPLLGPLLFDHKPITYIMLILVVVFHVLLFRSVWGLRTQAIGEHPKAAATVGINVNRMRFWNVVIGGCLAGLAGAWLSIETTFNFDDKMTNGLGFIALAAMIFGKWRPLAAFGGALLFSSLNALQSKIQAVNSDFVIKTQFLQMLPYIITIIVLAGVIGRARPPAAVGKPYEQ